MSHDPNEHRRSVKQVGGQHYGEPGAYQHWDFAAELRMPYLHGCATKYLCRWKEKNGIADVEKSLSYVRKAKLFLPWTVPCISHEVVDAVMRLFGAYRNSLYDEIGRPSLAGRAVTDITFSLMMPAPKDQLDSLDNACRHIEELLQRLEFYKPVPLTEENHYAEREPDTKR